MYEKLKKTSHNLPSLKKKKVGKYKYSKLDKRKGKQIATDTGKFLSIKEYFVKSWEYIQKLRRYRQLLQK